MTYKNCEKRIESFAEVYKNCTLLIKGGDRYECKEQNKNESGKCCSWDCPVAYIADMEAIRNVDLELYLEKVQEASKYPDKWGGAGRSQKGGKCIIPPYSGDDVLMVVYREVIENE